MKRYPMSWAVVAVMVVAGGSLWGAGTEPATAPAGATVPVQESTAWGQGQQVGKVEGKVYGAAGVDLSGQGQVDVFIAAEKGDRLFRWNGRAFEDVTTKVNLISKSQQFAWGDFRGSGRLGLASFHGQQLDIYTQGSDGVFGGYAPGGRVPPAGHVGPEGLGLGDGCVGLTTLDAGHKGRAALLVSTQASPIIVAISPDIAAPMDEPRRVVTGDFPGQDLGEAAKCIVADFDGDGWPDIIQLFAHGGLLYKGTKPGEFAAPVKIGVAAGPGRQGVCVGDWEGSGRLDIFTSCEKGNHLWHNQGGGQFAEALDPSGAMACLAKPGGTFCQTAACNGDGRQGLFIIYNKGLPQLYFNRGLRSFGLARELENALKVVPQTDAGVQAGCLGDFRKEGALGVLLVLANGDVWFFPQKVEKKTRGIAVTLSSASTNAGPVMVWVGRDQRPFGVAPVRVGEAGLLYSLMEAGPVTVKWQFSGSAVQQKDVMLEDGVQRVVIDKEPAKASAKPSTRPAEKTGGN